MSFQEKLRQQGQGNAPIISPGEKSGPGRKGSSPHIIVSEEFNYLEQKPKFLAWIKELKKTDVPDLWGTVSRIQQFKRASFTKDTLELFLRWLKLEGYTITKEVA